MRQSTRFFFFFRNFTHFPRLHGLGHVFLEPQVSGSHLLSDCFAGGIQEIGFLRDGVTDLFPCAAPCMVCGTCCASVFGVGGTPCELGFDEAVMLVWSPDDAGGRGRARDGIRAGIQDPGRVQSDW